MMINRITSNISFGKQAVGEFNIKQKTKDGKTKTVPVTVYRLDSEDCNDCFTHKRVKDINLGVCFQDKHALDYNESDYIIEKKSNGKLLGIAECIKSKDDMFLSTIGTSRKKKYKGVGRALLAGIVNDIKDLHKEIIVPTPLPSSSGFYKKCHFDYYDSDSTYYLDEANYDKLISDAKKQA